MPDTSYHTIEKTLQEAAAEGDQKAFKQLFDHYQNKLFQYIFRMVKSKQVAEELVMDVFLKLWLGRAMLKEIEKLDGFLFRVAYTKTIDFFRAAARDKIFADQVWEQMAIQSSDDVYNNLVSKEYEEHLRKVIDLLPPRRKTIFEMSREGNLSHDEISKQLNISKSTVANTITEAKQFIKEHLPDDLNLLSFAVIFAALDIF